MQRHQEYTLDVFGSKGGLIESLEASFRLQDCYSTELSEGLRVEVLFILFIDSVLGEELSFGLNALLSRSSELLSRLSAL